METSDQLGQKKKKRINKKKIVGEIVEGRIKQKFLKAPKRQTDGEPGMHVRTHTHTQSPKCKHQSSTRLIDCTGL